MSNIVIISGSPTATSRLFAITDFAKAQLEQQGHHVEHIKVAELSAEALIKADFKHPDIIEASKRVEEADGVIIASPVYKATYTGVLKTFLDLLPQKGLAHKPILPLFIGGTLAHLLAIDYGVKPLLTALGAQTIHTGVYAIDEWVKKDEQLQYLIDEQLRLRLEQAVAYYSAWLK